MTRAKTFSFDREAIEALFKPYDSSHEPGVAVGIAHQGVPLYRAGFGLANMELPVALGPGIRMRIGSTTKHFTSLAYLLLVEQGLASLDDPVRKHLPELSAVADRISMRQLMGHISGLRCSMDLVVHLAGIDTPLSTAEQLALFARQDDVNFQPGQRWSYNNGAYLLLSLAIERITRQPLEDVLTQRIFQPVGMFDTLLRRRDDDFVPNSAAQHMLRADGTWVRGSIGPSVAGEGAIVSTVDDMLRWLAHMQHPTVGTAASWAALSTPLHLDNGVSTGYGLGLMRNDYRGIEVVHHAGGVVGGSCQMLKVPELALDIVVISNGVKANVVGLADQIIDLCVDGLAPRAGTQTGAVFEGHYHCPDLDTVVRFFPLGEQQAAVVEGMPLPLQRAEGWLRSGMPQVATAFRIVGGAPESPQLVLHEYGRDHAMTRLQPTPSALPPTSERFLNAASGAVARFETRDGTPQLRVDAPFGRHPMYYTMQNLGPHLWELQPQHSLLPLAGVSLRMVSEADTFFLTTARNMALSFRKVDA
ncbi:serine hydrolase domain-containing protein [Xanthomonas massiliensis]|uniref:serine hydrolase domain-containing protein n=1 Tax=Xanthomonas massiliensis TaxID=1720302 RepID=UPI000824C28F|nr:serine hydrolase domain-containing protein [Xanthomonas massiliensis]